MTNPFQYGGVVRGAPFCNRKREVEDVLRAMENGEKLFVYSERRCGKTSLVRFALDRLPTVITALSLLSIGFSKSGYSKHNSVNSQGALRGQIFAQERGTSLSGITGVSP